MAKTIEEMKKVVREDFAKDNNVTLIGFLTVENTVEIPEMHPDYTQEGVTLVAYKGNTGELTYELLTDMYDNIN